MIRATSGKLLESLHVPELRHRSFSSSERLVGILSPIVEPPTALLRIADIHHHHEADHLGRAVEITEGIVHRRRLRILAKRLTPIYSDNAELRSLIEFKKKEQIKCV
jgi:hypothetical protein